MTVFRTSYMAFQSSLCWYFVGIWQVLHFAWYFKIIFIWLRPKYSDCYQIYIGGFNIGPRFGYTDFAAERTCDSREDSGVRRVATSISPITFLSQQTFFNETGAVNDAIFYYKRLRVRHWIICHSRAICLGTCLLVAWTLKYNMRWFIAFW